MSLRGDLTPTHARQCAAAEAGVLPESVAIRDGIFAIAIPLEIAFPPYTLAYTLSDTAGNVHVIDPGWDSESNWARLTDALHGIGHTADDVATVIVTHMHRDHLGMADRIRRATGTRVAMHGDAY